MRLILISFLCFMVLPCLASKVTAVATGDWDDDATWDLTAPGCYDSICIPSGITVTITSTEDLEACSAILVFVEGRLEFQTGKKIKLPCGNSAVILEIGGSMGVGGGGGASTYLTVCGDVIWNASMGDATGYILLPIELCCMEANMFDRKAYLTWVTKSELNNEGFDIQRSYNGVDWENLGFVSGAGSSTETITYQFIDEDPELGFNYYRLVQYDFDRKSEIFDPILLVNGEPELKKDLYVFPNPVSTDRLVIYVNAIESDLIKFNLYSSNGTLAISGQAPYFIEYCIITLPPEITSGTYFIQIGDFIERVIVL